MYLLLPLCIAFLGALLHAYENLFKADHVSLGWFAWSMAPYAVCLIVWMRASTSVPAAVGVAIALIFDLYVHYHVFIYPRSSTVGLAMIFAPLWSALLFCPVGMLVTWLVVQATRKYSRQCLGVLKC
jgi:hypothetical protein